MKPLLYLNEAKENVNLYKIRVEVGSVPLWTGVYAENVERANRIAEKIFGKGKVKGRPTKVKESIQEAVDLASGVEYDWMGNDYAIFELNDVPFFIKFSEGGNVTFGTKKGTAPNPNPGLINRLFATLINIIQDYIKRKNPHDLYFFGGTPSRNKFYKRLLNKFKAGGYSVTPITWNGYEGFMMQKSYNVGEAKNPEGNPLAYRLPPGASWYKTKFPFKALRGDRRFMYSPKHDVFVIGAKDPLVGKGLKSSHAEEFAESDAPGAYDDYLFRGWVGIGGVYRSGIIHFAPDVPKIALERPRYYDAAVQVLRAFQKSGATANTVVRNMGEIGERKLSSGILEVRGPKKGVDKGSQKRYKHPLATDKPEQYIGKWEAYDEPQGIHSKAGQKMVHAESQEEGWEILPDVKTYSPEEIAHKHGVDVREVMAQLRMGIEEEFEHTKSKALAREIALDHLLEDPKYYSKLAAMEGSLGPEFSRGLTNSSTGGGAVPTDSGFDPKILPNTLRPKRGGQPGRKAPTKQVLATVGKSITNKVRKPFKKKASIVDPNTFEFQSLGETRLDELFGGGEKLPHSHLGNNYYRVKVTPDIDVLVGTDDIRSYVRGAEPGVNIGFSTQTSDGETRFGFERENLGVDHKTMIALFNTVIELVQHIVRQKNPDVVYFIAVQPMKGIYPKLLKRFVDQSEWSVSKGAANIHGNDVDVYKAKRRSLEETIRLPVHTDFNADYDVKDGERTVGVAKVDSGVISKMAVNDEAADEQFKGHVLSTLLGTIIRDADLQRANLSMQIGDPEDQKMKRFLERFGFRHVTKGVFKRTAGAITPPSVIEKKQIDESMSFTAWKKMGNRWDLALPREWTQELRPPPGEEYIDWGRYQDDDEYEKAVKNPDFRPELDLNVANDNAHTIMRFLKKEVGLKIDPEDPEGFSVPVKEFVWKVKAWTQKPQKEPTPAIEPTDSHDPRSPVDPRIGPMGQPQMQRRREGNVVSLRPEPKGVRVIGGGREAGYDEKKIKRMLEIAEIAMEHGATHVGLA